jgi:hypothetical protein
MTALETTKRVGWAALREDDRVCAEPTINAVTSAAMAADIPANGAAAARIGENGVVPAAGLVC